MARTAKVSITIDAAVLASAKKRARAARKNLSAFISDLIADSERNRRLGEALDALDREFGPVPEAEVNKARAILAQPDSKMRKRPRKKAA